MLTNRFLDISLSALPAAVFFVELFLILPIKKSTNSILKTAGKAFLVLRSKNISDHWKEKVLFCYSRQIMTYSFIVGFFLVLLFVAFATIYCTAGLFFIGDLNAVLETFSRAETHVIIGGLGLLYIILRIRLGRNKPKIKTDYTFTSKLLHHLALGSSVIKEVAFDIDCMLTKIKPVKPKVLSPVYIAGLARGGTTILLEALYSSGMFTTLTYRDMPWVTAPYLWSKLSTFGQIEDDTKKERAHGDNLYVNYDSPEAFEEVFWLTMSSAAYVRENYLDITDIDSGIVKSYTKYVQNIIAKRGDGSSTRYLAKNNNNIIRIGAIKSAFEDAIIIVPFRNPINHAKSLLFQHQRFLERHTRDPFSLKYMNWLGHFEFGANFKPIMVDHDVLPLNKQEPEQLDYWMRYWACVYKYLIERHSSNVIFWDYDKFCEQPAQYFEKMEFELKLERGSLKRFSTNIRPTKAPVAEEIKFPSTVKKVYDALQYSNFLDRT